MVSLKIIEIINLKNDIYFHQTGEANCSNVSLFIIFIFCKRMKTSFPLLFSPYHLHIKKKKTKTSVYPHRSLRKSLVSFRIECNYSGILIFYNEGITCPKQIDIGHIVTYHLVQLFELPANETRKIFIV